MKSLTKTKKHLTKIKNEILISSEHCLQENDTTQEILSALNNNKKNITISFNTFGMDINDEYNIANMVSFLATNSYIDLANFIKNKTDIHYNEFMNSIFIGVMANICSLKYDDSIYASNFDSETSSYILFSLAYLDKDLQTLCIKKLNHLIQYRKDHKEDNICYAGDSILPMAC